MGRPRKQDGSVVRQGGKWLLKWREYDAHGKATSRTKTLCDRSAYPKESDVRDAFKQLINDSVSIQNEATPADGLLTLGQFIEQRYFPNLEVRQQIPAGNEKHIEPSTVKGYRDIWRKHAQPSAVICKTPLRQFNPTHGQQFMDGIPQHLSHSTHLRIKNFLKGVFTYALQQGTLTGWNPMDPTKAYGVRKNVEGTNQRKLSEREQKIKASNEHAYSLEEVAEMLNNLPDPARTVCAVAAFTGLTHSELPVLKWSDYDGETLSVSRKLWKQHIGAPKTLERSKGVYVIEPLRKILAAYKEAFPPGEQDWVFYGAKSMRPLNLDNLSRREIPGYINGAWFGWHAFRRGLGTRLNEAKVPDKSIQMILRHADVSTTQAYYIKPTTESAKRGLQKFSRLLATKYKIK